MTIGRNGLTAVGAYEETLFQKQARDSVLHSDVLFAEWPVEAQGEPPAGPSTKSAQVVHRGKKAPAEWVRSSSSREWLRLFRTYVMSCPLLSCLVPLSCVAATVGSPCYLLARACCVRGETYGRLFDHG
jgi:hypothetical protein